MIGAAAIALVVAIALDQRTQRSSPGEEMLLADHVVEVAGAQPGRQRRSAREPLLGRCAEQILPHACDPTGGR